MPQKPKKSYPSIYIFSRSYFNWIHHISHKSKTLFPIMNPGFFFTFLTPQQFFFCKNSWIKWLKLKNPGGWFDLKPCDDSCMRFIYECYKLCDPPSGIEICCPTNPKILFFVRMPKRSGNCTTIFQWNGKYRKCKAKRNAFFDHILLIYNTLCFKIRGKSAIVRRLSICLPKTSKGKIKDFLIKNQMEFMCLRFRN